MNHYFFQQNIFEDSLAINPLFFKKVKKVKLQKHKEVQTSFWQTLDPNLINETTEYLNSHFLNIAKELGKKSYKIESMWIQKYNVGDYHNLHLHEKHKDSYSFILYIDGSSRSGTTRFFNLGYPYIFLYELEIKPQKGKCVVFLGCLPHESTPSKDNKKTIISGNIKFV